MNISRHDLSWAADRNIISAEQAESLWVALQEKSATRPGFNIVHVLYYFGGLIVIGSMSWFMTLGWEVGGGLGILAISIAYALCFSLAARSLWRSGAFRIPGGILFTAAVWMTPLAMYGLERLLGWWPKDDPGSFREYHVYVRAGWLLMEAATIIVGCVTLRFIRFPFLTFPIAFAFWYMSMDLTPMLFGTTAFSMEEREMVSVVVGGLMLLATYFIDRRTPEDFAFWGYLFGLCAFWGGLSMMNSGSEVAKFVYALLNVGLIFLSVFLSRRVFAVFGSLGVFGYLSHLAYTVFENSIMFPFVLSILGIAVIIVGVKFQTNRSKLEALVLRLPPTVRRLRPVER